jgi:pimeloyl-ACP methyl ester carboxylesterase
MRLARDGIDNLVAAVALQEAPIASSQWPHAAHPSASVVMRTAHRTIDGVRIRYAESSRACERTLLLTSPWPGSLNAFAPVWSTLRRRFHLLAVDLPGFGGSERAEALAAPRAMGSFLTRVIEDFGLDQVHLIGPDIGTSAALFAAAEAPQSIASVVVGSGGAAVPIQLGAPLSDWVLAPSRHRFGTTDCHVVLDAALDTIERHGQIASPPDRGDFHAGDRFVESMRYVGRDRQEFPALTRLLPAIQTPVLIVTGSHDRVAPAGSGRFLAARLPNSQLLAVDSGHFVWEDAPDQYASLLIDWVTSGYRVPGALR